jgi:chemotaxis-related protein WspD
MSEPGPSNSTPAQAAHADAVLRLLDRPITSAELEAGAEMAARPSDAQGKQSLRLLLFRLGDEIAALPTGALRRVTPAARASKIPHRSSGVLRGVCNIRGELVLCADLRRLLGLPEPDAEHADASFDSRRMVVVGPAENSWAFEVDALMGVESIDPSLVREPPLTVGYSIGDFTRGLADIGGHCVTILDGERVLAGFNAGLA